MTTSKYTTWINKGISQFSGEDYIIRRNDPKNEEIVARVPVECGEHTANLVTAAPELLEALEELNDILWQAKHDGAVGNPVWVDAMQKGSTAIAKARGAE